MCTYESTSERTFYTKSVTVLTNLTTLKLAIRTTITNLVKYLYQVSLLKRSLLEGSFLMHGLILRSHMYSLTDNRPTSSTLMKSSSFCPPPRPLIFVRRWHFGLQRGRRRGYVHAPLYAYIRPRGADEGYNTVAMVIGA